MKIDIYLYGLKMPYTAYKAIRKIYNFIYLLTFYFKHYTERI